MLPLAHQTRRHVEMAREHRLSLLFAEMLQSRIYELLPWNWKPASHCDLAA